MNKVIIDRAKWSLPLGYAVLAGSNKQFTGGNFVGNLLINNSDMKCCLGFLGLSCGIQRDVLLNKQMPGNKVLWPEPLFHNSSTNTHLWQSIFAIINDYPNIDNETREAWVSEGFKTILGYEVEFIGKYGSNT